MFRWAIYHSTCLFPVYFSLCTLHFSLYAAFSRLSIMNFFATSTATDASRQ